MTRVFLTLTLTLTCTLPARAGLHYSGEVQNDLPANWRGFLPDHRLLRSLAIPQAATPLHDTHADALLRLEAAARAGPLTADQAADLGALYVRLGKPEKAVEAMRTARRQWPDHFRLAANLGTAWQLAGDLEQAAASLDDAVRLAPAKWKPAEELHLKLVRLRAREGKVAKDANAVDDLFGMRFVGPSGQPEPGAIQKMLTENAAALVQQLALWMPADGRLLWQLGEIANATGDVRTAANILDGCVTELGMKSPDLRARRQVYRAAADAIAKREEHDKHRGTLAFKSARPLARTIDVSKLPPVKPDGVNQLPWAVLAETTLGRKFPPAYLKYLEQLDGKRVSLVGFMRPTTDGKAELTGFLMTEYAVGCWFCESPDPTGIVNVELAAGHTAEYGRSAIKVVGVLKLNRSDPEGYLYTLTEAKVGVAD
jgi:tetratricopeptide (TPR) repeat protein